MTVFIRKATNEDTLAIARVHTVSWQTAYRGLVPDEYLDNLDPQITKKKWEMNMSGWGTTMVSETAGTITGFSQMFPSRDEDTSAGTGEIGGFYLHPEIWRKGVGTLLMKESLEFLKKDFDDVILWVMAGNVRAIGFYESVGFKSDRKEKKITHRGGFQLHELRYRLNLRTKDSI